MSTTGEIVGGLIIPVVAGVLNGSWNAAFSPAANLAVGNSESKNAKPCDLCHHHAWVLFQFYAAIANIILCLFWAGGPERVSWIVTTASTKSVVFTSVFGVLMGMGITLFGEACRIAGVGMGTNLTIGIIMILGTILPLATNNQVATSSGGVIIGGLAVATFGLFFSMKSLQLKDIAEMNMEQLSSNNEIELEESTGRASLVMVEEGEKNEEVIEQAELSDSNDEESYSTVTKIVICAFAAILSSTLQFAFVFGGELMDLAASSDGPGSTPATGVSSIIWLFVIPLSTIPNIIFALYKAKDVSIDHMWKCPWTRHLKIFFAACLPWVGHINLYGLASSLLLPPNIAAAVAWPILMMTTVAWGMILSIYLGEWKTAPPAAATKQKIGLGWMLLGVAVVMASVALN